jgi:hypothetical protein
VNMYSEPFSVTMPYIPSILPVTPDEAFAEVTGSYPGVKLTATPPLDGITPPMIVAVIG